MFLEGYKRNWLYSEGYSFEDRMIDDLSVSVMSHLFYLEMIFLYLYLPFLPLCIVESNGTRGRR